MKKSKEGWIKRPAAIITTVLYLVGLAPAWAEENQPTVPIQPAIQTTSATTPNDQSFPSLEWFASNVDHNPELVSLVLRSQIDPGLPTLADAIEAHTELSAYRPIAQGSSGASSFLSFGAAGSTALASSLALNLPGLIKQLITGRKDREKMRLLREAEYFVARARVMQQVSDAYFARMTKCYEMQAQQAKLVKLVASQDKQQQALIQQASTTTSLKGRKPVQMDDALQAATDYSAEITEVQYTIGLNTLELKKLDYDLYALVSYPASSPYPTKNPTLATPQVRTQEAAAVPAPTSVPSPQQLPPSTDIPVVKATYSQPAIVPAVPDKHARGGESRPSSPAEASRPVVVSSTLNDAYRPVWSNGGETATLRGRVAAKPTDMNSSSIFGYVESREDRPQSITITVSAYDHDQSIIEEWNESIDVPRKGIVNFQKEVEDHGKTRKVTVDVFNSKGEKIAQF